MPPYQVGDIISAELEPLSELAATYRGLRDADFKADRTDYSPNHMARDRCGIILY